AKEITVDGNGDNSIQTNDFDVTNGANCIAVSAPSITTVATSATVGTPIHDTATLSGIPAGTGGSITFKAFLRTGANPDCSGSAAFTSTVPVTGPGDYGS